MITLTNRMTLKKFKHAREEAERDVAKPYFCMALIHMTMTEWSSNHVA
jgi:hypothetical protein